jgi:hypothetical protein
MPGIPRGPELGLAGFGYLGELPSRLFTVDINNCLGHSVASVGIGKSRPFAPRCAHGPRDLRHQPGEIRDERVKVGGSHHAPAAMAARGVAPRQCALFFQPGDAGLRRVHHATGAVGDAVEAEAAHIADMGDGIGHGTYLVGEIFAVAAVRGNETLHLRQPLHADGEGEGRFGIIARQGHALRCAVSITAEDSAKALHPAHAGRVIRFWQFGHRFSVAVAQQPAQGEGPKSAQNRPLAKTGFSLDGVPEFWESGFARYTHPG